LPTTNARKSVKGSKHADFSLFSLMKNKELPLGDWSHGQVTLAKQA